MDPMIFQGVTLAVALVGAVLGVMNTWRNISQDRLRLVVRPTQAYFDNGSHQLSVEVTNLSTFPVTLTNYGFFMHGTRRHLQFIPDFPRGETLPVRLEPRTSVTAFLRHGATEVDGFARVRSAYVLTACGNTVEATSSALNAFVMNEARARL